MIPAEEKRPVSKEQVTLNLDLEVLLSFLKAFKGFLEALSQEEHKTLLAFETLRDALTKYALLSVSVSKEQRLVAFSELRETFLKALARRNEAEKQTSAALEQLSSSFNQFEALLGFLEKTGMKQSLQ